MVKVKQFFRGEREHLSHTREVTNRYLVAHAWLNYACGIVTGVSIALINK